MTGRPASMRLAKPWEYKPLDRDQLIELYRLGKIIGSDGEDVRVLGVRDLPAGPALLVEWLGRHHTLFAEALMEFRHPRTKELLRR